MTFDNNLIINLSSMVTLFVINYLKYRADINLSTKKNEESHKYLRSELEVVRNSVNQILIHQQFEKLMYDKLTETAFNIMTLNPDLDAKISLVLNTTLIKVRDFASKHHKSPYRKNKDIVKNYLKIESNTIFSNIDGIVDDIFGTKKIDGKTYSYSEFAKEFSDIKIIVNIMLRRLADNGFTDDEYIKSFDRFIRELMTEQINIWRKWNNKR